MKPITYSVNLIPSVIEAIIKYRRESVMSLSLGVKLYGSVFIEDTRFVLTQVNEDRSFRLSSGNKDYLITVEEPTIIYPDVECYNSPYGSTKDSVRMIFKAPQDIIILRGKIYWQNAENREVEID